MVKYACSTMPVNAIIPNEHLPEKEGDFMPTLDHPNDAFHNQDIVHLLTVDELRELSNLKELRRSTTATLSYFQEREKYIFSQARTRQPVNEAGGGPVNDQCHS
jgi:hypothetical protein